MQIIKELEGSLMSDVYLVNHHNTEKIYKEADNDIIENELYFQYMQKQHGLNHLNGFSHGQGILMDYIVDSPTIDSIYGRKNACTVFERRGKQVRKLHSISSDCFSTFLKRTRHAISIELFINKCLEKGKNRVKSHGSSLDKRYIDGISNYISDLYSYSPKRISLVHGDLHLNNVLINEGEIILFDQSSFIRYADPLRDLALIVIMLPNNTLLHTDQTDHKYDKEYLEAFVTGYGTNFLLEDKDIFYKYILLRAFTRYPNKWELQLKTIMDNILSLSL